LPHTFFTAKELDDAEKKSMPIIFAKEGFNRNTSCALLYGPSGYARGGHFRWQWLQGEGKIMSFWNSGAPRDKLAQCSELPFHGINITLV
jgi:hypothetical protein